MHPPSPLFTHNFRLRQGFAGPAVAKAMAWHARRRVSI